MHVMDILGSSRNTDNLISIAAFELYQYICSPGCAQNVRPLPRYRRPCSAPILPLSACLTSSNKFPRLLVTPRTELILFQPRPLQASPTSPGSSRAVPTRPDLFRSQLNRGTTQTAIKRRLVGFSPSGADDVHDSHTAPPIPGPAHDCSASCRSLRF